MGSLARPLSLTNLAITLLVTLFFSLSVFGSETTLRKRLTITKKTKISFAQTSKKGEENMPIEKMAILEKKREALIADIMKFMRQSSDSEQKDELRMRLANLYMEDYYSKLSKAQLLHQKALEDFDKLPEKERKRRRPPQMEKAQYLDSLKKSRNLYQGMLAKVKNHPRGDEILYFLASSSLDLNRMQEAMTYYGRLAAEYPKSPYYNESLIQLADYYFDKAKWVDAQKYYEDLIRLKYKPLMAYAYYKRGWCQFNSGNPKGAIQSYQWVISQDESDAEGNNLRIRNEAIRDIALTFVDLKQPEQAISFYTTLGEPYTRRGYETMASLYNEGGQYANAIQLWEALLASNRTHENNPKYVLDIVEAYRRGNQTAPAISALFNNLPAYTKNSGWYEFHANKPQLVKEAIEGFEDMARKLAIEAHAQAQKMKSDKLYQSAQDLYSLYLENFPDSAHSTQIRFYLAEILYKRNDYKSAANQYYKVYKSPDAGKLKVDSIRYALNALDRQLNTDRKEAGLSTISAKTQAKLADSGDANLEVIPYTKVETGFIKIAEEYLKDFPNNKDAPDVLYTQAYLRYTHHELNESYTGFWEFMKKYSKHPSAYSAEHLILDILNRKQNYDKLVAASEQFLKTPGLTKPEFRAEVSQILRSAELKRIQVLETAGKFQEAADGYIGYTQAYGAKDPVLYEKALYNASINYTKAGQTLKSVETQEKFLRRFNTSPFAKTMLLAVANTYQKLGRFNKAADFYYEFAKRFPQEEQAKTAHRLAGLFYWGSGKNKEAEGVMNQFLTAYPKGKERELVQTDLLGIYETQRDFPKQVAFYKNKRATENNPASYVIDSVHIADLLAQSNPKAAAGVFQEVHNFSARNLASITKDNDARNALARVEFWRVTQVEKQFTSIPLSLPQARLQANLKNKIQLLGTLENEYKRVAALGSGEWAMGALFKTASAYRHMAQAVNQAPVPPELAGEQIEQYRSEVKKNLVDPFEEKALAFSVQCVEKAQELNLLTVWVSKCYDLVGTLDPKRYPHIRTLFLPPVQTALIMPTDKEIPLGKVRNYAIPVYSTGMFSKQTLQRTLASEENRSLMVLNDYDENHLTAPKGLTYNLLSPIRLKTLAKDLQAHEPKDKEIPSFAYLNLARLVYPQKALTQVLEAIERQPDSVALHNLLGLTHLEMNDIAAAKVTWLSLVARGEKNAAIWNNLGVVSMLLGKENEAIDYFQQATQMENPGEAFVNMGFIALKYHNGFEAKKNFTEALKAGDASPATKVGLNVARLQNREIDSAVEILPELSERYNSDPYARLSAAFLMIDIMGQKDAASKMLTEYMDRFFARSDPLFRQALGESAKNVAPSDDGLPELDL